MAAQVEVEVLEERLKSFLCQLQAESGILDRIIYKNKNQHRRCSYFQYLLKVRRNLKLFHSIHMEELLDSCFNVFTGRKAKQKAHLLESLKRRKCDSGRFNFMERLHGAARLLSEMVEPMLKAATEISTLLARSFFMGFSVMILALLARVRVLVQQMLLDVISVFNEVSSHAQKKQSIKITQDGIEVFREYHPTMEEEEVLVLEGVWKTDKFVLVETSVKSNINQGGSSETVQTLGTSVKYRSIGSFLGDDEFDSKKADVNKEGEDSLSNSKRNSPESPPPMSNEYKDHHTERTQMPSSPEQGSGNVLKPNESIPLEDSSVASSMTSSISSSSKPNYTSNKRVAFIAVKKTAPSVSEAPAVSQANDSSKGKRHDDEDSSLFSLLTEDETRGSIF
ncbi:hypothetical protein BVRB_9g223360 [Beta vulgaris subsp. vulgaris]|uniref:uncharacterized protein LOC104904907 isoform X1 n=1 Tax=Beta vulgaris subsp. vulgaris TaxID=3555 RepID=UPI00054013DC|nr:uncharacterized protein LOC104904907 isoform X1 [Beta vulgaris subsp. vulgaris]KMT01081.1 hypothetical protein BVRB_9g223360 [Beta vulgaris subsp. vulgaris]